MRIWNTLESIFSSNKVFLILLGVSFATLMLAFFVPIYMDDIMYHIAASRAGYDGWVNNGVMPLCKNNQGVPIPLSLLPGRTLAWLFYYPISTPIAVRLFGIGTFVAWVGFTVWGLKKCVISDRSCLQITSFVISLSFLGVLPFMATLLRPETSLALGVAFFAFLPFYLQKNTLQPKSYIAVLLLCLLVASWLFSAHPKALFYAPLALYTFWCLRKNTISWWLSLAIFFYIILQVCSFYAHILSCPESKYFDNFIRTRGLPPDLLLSDPVIFIRRFISNLIAAKTQLLSINFQGNYAARWLPPIPLHLLHKIINVTIIIITAYTLVFWLIALFDTVKNLFKDKKLNPNNVVPILLLIGLISVLGFEASDRGHFYDVVFTWLVGVCLTSIWLFNCKLPLWKTISHYGTIGLALVSITSQIVLMHSFSILPAIAKNADDNGILQYQKIGVASMLNYAARKERILHLAVQCDIYPEQPQYQLAVDMFTYFPFRETTLPFYSDKQSMRDLKERNSTGLIALCRSMPLELQKFAISENELCCVSKKRLDEIQ